VIAFPVVPPTTEVGVAVSEPAFTTPVRRSFHPDAEEAPADVVSSIAEAAIPSTRRRAGRRKRKV
jgi:hypothetical protein